MTSQKTTAADQCELGTYFNSITRQLRELSIPEIEQTDDPRILVWARQFEASFTKRRVDCVRLSRKSTDKPAFRGLALLHTLNAIAKQVVGSPNARRIMDRFAVDLAVPLAMVAGELLADADIEGLPGKPYPPSLNDKRLKKENAIYDLLKSQPKRAFSTDEIWEVVRGGRTRIGLALQRLVEMNLIFKDGRRYRAARTAR